MTDTQTESNETESHAESIWNQHPDNSATAPRYCPHCGEQMAHPDDMKANDRLPDDPGRREAYSRHRQAHFEWGTDPAEVFWRGDPYLDDYYEDNPGKGSRDKDEVVAHEYDVTITYEARLKTKVVASTEHQAKKKAKEMRGHGTDLYGDTPEAHISMELHDEARENKPVTRRMVENSEDVDEDDEDEDGVNYADRLPGWPW